MYSLIVRKLHKIRYFHLFLVVLCTFFFTNVAFSQQYTIRNYLPSDGLASSNIYCSTQDSKGFMWFGTDAGVSRFDGRRFESFTMDDGVSDNEVFKIFEDKQNRIWFLTLSGRLSFYQNGIFYNESNMPFLKSVFLGQSWVDYFIDEEGKIWLSAVGNKIICIDGDIVRRYQFQNNFLGTGMVFIERQKGKPDFYLGRNNLIFDNQTKRFSESKLCPEGFSYNRTISVGSDTKTSIRVCREGLVRVGASCLYDTLLYAFSPNESEDNYNAIHYNGNGEIWVSTRNQGLLIFNQKDSLRINRILLKGVIQNSLFKDREGNFWIASQNKGLYMIPSGFQKITYYNSTDGLPSDNLFSLASIGDNMVIVGTDNGGVATVSLLNGIVENFYLDTQSAAQNRVLSLITDSANTLWIGTDQGVFSNKENTDVLVRYPILTDQYSLPYSVKNITMGKDGTIFIAHFAGIAEKKPDDWKFVNLLQSRETIRTYSCFQASTGLYVSNIQGLHLYKSDTLIPLYQNAPVLRERITRITEAHDSTLILSTNGKGLVFYKNGKVINTLTRESGLPSNQCQGVFISKDLVWVATNKGMCRFKYKNNIISEVLVINRHNGLLSEDVRDVFYEKGNVFAATSQGLFIMDESLFYQSATPPPVYFRFIKTDNREYTGLKNITLSHNEGPLQIGIGAINFLNPNAILYQYRTDATEAWINTRNDEIVLSNLPPGIYNIQVRAKNAGSKWSLPVVEKINVVAPFWRSSWFSLSIIIIILSLAFSIYFSKQKATMKKKIRDLETERAVTLERERISRDLHDDLGADLTGIVMNSEFLKNQKNPDIQFNKHVQAIYTSSRETVEKIGEILWAMNTQNDSLKNLLGYITEHVGASCEKRYMPVKMTVPSDVPDVIIGTVAKRNLFLAMKEGLNNIFKHAGATEVKYAIEIKPYSVKLSLEDNGIGFDPSSTREHGYGIKNLKKRMEEIGASIHVESSPGNGSKMTIDYFFKM
ncbi:MAG TPA: two-component regulator propeller domain-containing protein [Bacteroidia bacterium]|nr:two-component regulator propeller domain-containing protein [Bacteroidia bacterium]